MNVSACRPPYERALDKFVRRGPDDCWIWHGSATLDGYGLVGVPPYRGPKRAGNLYAHRLIYEAEVGPIPDGHEVDHLCFNTRCVNPAHLEPVTPDENRRRRRLRRASSGRFAPVGT